MNGSYLLRADVSQDRPEGDLPLAPTQGSSDGGSDRAAIAFRCGLPAEGRTIARSVRRVRLRLRVGEGAGMNALLGILPRRFLLACGERATRVDALLGILLGRPFLA